MMTRVCMRHCFLEFLQVSFRGALGVFPILVFPLQDSGAAVSIQTYPRDLISRYKPLRYRHYANVEAGEIRKQQEELILRDMNRGL